MGGYQPQYGKEHKRIRKRLIEAGLWIGQPCHHCGKPMMPGQPLALGHAYDAAGYSIPGRYIGLTHHLCESSSGGKINPWNRRVTAAAGRAARSPARVQQLEDVEARRTRKQDRDEFDRIQAAIAADEIVAQDDEASGRDW